MLVVVDNYETITDGALLAWLLRLPEPSKAIVTSREYGREFRRNCWPVELRGMSDAEALTFIGHRLRVLRMDSLVERSRLIEPLISATGGNPKAIECFSPDPARGRGHATQRRDLSRRRRILPAARSPCH